MSAFEKKTVIVTGVGKGRTIGYGVAEAFAREGARVVLTGRGASKLKATARELEKGTGSEVAYVCVSDTGEAAVTAAVGDVLERFGRVDVLVNCSQAAKSGVELHELAAEDMQLAFDTGPIAAFLWMKACHPHLVKTGGAVLNFISYAGMEGMPGQAPLAVAKEGVRALSAVASNEWAAEGVRVNCVCALARTAQLERWAREFPQAYEAFEAGLPEGGLASIEEVGRACVQIAFGEDAGKSFLVTGDGVRRLQRVGKHGDEDLDSIEVL